MRPLAARCRLGLGLLAHRAGREAEAQEHVRAAGRLFDQLGMAAELKRAWAALAALSLPAPDAASRPALVVEPAVSRLPVEPARAPGAS